MPDRHRVQFAHALMQRSHTGHIIPKHAFDDIRVLVKSLPKDRSRHAGDRCVADGDDAGGLRFVVDGGHFAEIIARRQIREDDVGSISRGDLLTFGGAVAFSAHIVATGHFAEQIGYEVLSVTQVGAAALSALSLVWWVETPRLQWQPLVVWAILITGLLCTALAFTIQAWAQHYTTSTRTALIYALEPVVAWITSFCIAGEGLSGRAAAGAAFILSGVLLVEMKPSNARKHL